MGKPWWKDYEKPETPPRDWSSKQVADDCTAMACRFLTQRGMEVVEQDWSCRNGNVPVIAKEEDCTVVLVDIRAEIALGGDPSAYPKLGIDGECQRRYRKLMLSYLMDHPEVERARFDVTSVRILGEHDARLRHLVGAFNWES